jgi:hypothetical protein
MSRASLANESRLLIALQPPLHDSIATLAAEHVAIFEVVG